ncbi:MAG: hypothetical protein NVS2B7_07640 [Herpetosiphon sp.]
MNWTAVFQHVLNGLAIGSVYAIFALGYTLVFSILRIINFAHGGVFTLGAYFTYALTGSAFGANGLLANGRLPLRLPFLAALLLGGLLSAGVAVGIERVAFRPLRRRTGDPLLALVSSLGVSIVIVNMLQYLVGAEGYPFPDEFLAGLPGAINFGTATHPVPVRSVQVMLFVVSMMLVVMLTFLINGT